MNSCVLEKFFPLNLSNSNHCCQKPDGLLQLVRVNPSVIPVHLRLMSGVRLGSIYWACIFYMYVCVACTLSFDRPFLFLFFLK